MSHVSPNVTNIGMKLFYINEYFTDATWKALLDKGLSNKAAEVLCWNYWISVSYILSFYKLYAI